MTGIDSPLDRRRLLGAVAAGTGIGLVGCLGDSDGDDRGAAFVSHPIDEPTAVPEGHECNGPCSMDAAEYPDWNAQIAHANGDGAFFCSPGCLVAYFVHQDEFGAPAAAVAGVWFSEFGTGDLVDGTAAHYVLDDDAGRLEEPMDRNPKPFADRADAVAFVSEYDDLDESDIGDIGDFGPDLAETYRGDSLPTGD